MDPKYIPYITSQQMLEVDRLMVEKYGIELIQMMEIAGWQLARLSAKRFLDGDPAGKRILVLAGSGGNGGGALVSARILHNWGGGVDVVLSKSRDLVSNVIHTQLDILDSIELPVWDAADLDRINPPDLILDGIIGYSLRGAPMGNPAKMIRWANAIAAPTLALDLPSGLDPDTGKASDPVIQAAATMTLALPKIGLRGAGDQLVGELYLADIGVPPALFTDPSLDLAVGAIFQREEIIQL